MSPTNESKPETKGSATKQSFEAQHGMLCAQHDRLGASLRAIRQAAAQRLWPTTGFAKFRKGLERHLRFEEEALFPRICEVGVEQNRELIGQLLVEHAEIRRLLESVHCEFRHKRPVLELLDALTALLRTHEGKEELFLYPMIFHLADPVVVAEMLRHLRPTRLNRHPGTG